MPNTVLSDFVDLYSEVPNRGNPRIMKYSLRIKILFSTRINMFVIENNDEIADQLDHFDENTDEIETRRKEEI